MNSNHNLKNGIRTGWQIFVGVIVLSLLLSGCGNTVPKVYHVGVLSGFEFFAPTTDGFKAQMATLGYVEGKNIVYDVQKADFDIAAYKSILKKFVDDKVDLIFVFPTEAAQEAKAATQGTQVPVLFANANIEDTNLVNSVREPGGNVTGVRFPGPDIVAKRFEILLKLAPNIKRVCVPYMPYPIVPSQMAALNEPSKKAGVTVVEIVAKSPAELETLLADREGSPDVGCDAILTIPEPLVGAPDGFAVVAKFAAKHKLPLGGSPMAMGDYATVFGLTTDSVAVGKQAAPLADKILRGLSAGTIPVASADSYLQINMKAAQAIGLTVPDGLLKMAAEIIR
jgi:putative tryptophan/tyrosine transport system substrate-binding protein